MAEIEKSCFFWKLYACNKEDSLAEATAGRIIKASKQYGDGIHNELENQQQSYKNLTVHVHRKCVDKYCHPKTIQKALRNKGQELQCSSSSEPKRARRSEHSTFIALQHCLFCGETCDIQRDSKNPSRWRAAYVCRQGDTHENKGLKEAIKEVCNTVKNKQAEEILVRLAGVLTDLHAADIRYHVDCRCKFLSPRNIQAAVRESSHPISTEPLDIALQSVIRFLEQNRSGIFNSIDLSKEYKDAGGTRLSRKQLLQKLIDYFRGDLIKLTSPGIAAILVFKSNTANLLRMIPDDTDDTDMAVDKVAKKILGEIRDIHIDRENYHTHISKDICSQFQSDTLSDLLSKLNPRLNNSLPALMIGNMITAIIKNLATPLQITLAILLRDSKEHVKALHDFGVTCSYDELLRFKKSVACAANADMDLFGLVKDGNELVQGVGDNYDQEIASQNGKIQTHSMALLLTQNDIKADHDHDTLVRRLTKSEINKDIPYDIEIARYGGPKKPRPPEALMKVQVQPLSVLSRAAVSMNRARERDFDFFRVVSKGGPEYNGYNTKKTREDGQSSKPRTKAIYLPLIDMPPAEYDTILTSMLKIKQLTEATGQSFSIFTVDQQLHNYATQIQWALPKTFPLEKYFVRLGGMHTLMNVIGAIGSLMADTGLAEILSSVFGGVKKMLTGKKFPQCLRALRMVVEVILEPIFEDPSVKCYDDLLENLENRANKSRTCKLWNDCLIKPIFIMMAYVRAEREGDWPMHVECVKAMIVYVFAAGHSNYARSLLVYLRTIERLPSDILTHFLNGKHVMRHMEGLWNGIWSDMFIESTFMRYGHGRAGIVGVTLKPETLKTWALSRHVCSQLMEESACMRGETADYRFKTTHKEESIARMESDKKDRDTLRKKIGMCIQPLSPDTHPDQLVNLVTGSVAPSSVNVDRALMIAEEQVAEFQISLPHGYWNTIEKRVTTMSAMRKGIKVGHNIMYDTELIFSRVIGLQASSRNVDFQDVLSFELAPIPTALFDNSGEMRICKSKAVLKKQTKVDVSVRNVDQINCTILDGCAVLWIVPWPASSTTNQALVSDYVESFKHYLQRRLKFGDVYLVFDRYIEFSTKYSARKTRGPSGYKVFQLSSKSPLPPQNQLLSTIENKKQLIQIIVETLVNDPTVVKGYHTKLVVTGQNPTPTEISQEGITLRQDLKNTHEEADSIVVAQAIHAASEEGKHVGIVADDTDIYVMLIYYYYSKSLTVPMILLPTKSERSVIDIRATVDKLGDLCVELLPAHVLTGCDQVPMHHSIGKIKMWKVVKSGKCSLSLLGHLPADMETVVSQAMEFMCACYGIDQVNSMTGARVKTWVSRTGRKTASKMPKLCSLPPTSEAFKENVKRAHLQCAIWRRALTEPPDADPTEYGWVRDEETKSLQPVMLPESRQPAPAFIMKLVCCSCAAEKPCSTRACGCVSANLACTMYCRCQGSSICTNEQTMQVPIEHSDEELSDEEEADE